jgi:hypothetical protein
MHYYHLKLSYSFFMLPIEHFLIRSFMCLILLIRTHIIELFCLKILIFTFCFILKFNRLVHWFMKILFIFFSLCLMFLDPLLVLCLIFKVYSLFVFMLFVKILACLLLILYPCLKEEDFS